MIGTPNKTHASGLNDFDLIRGKTTLVQNDSIYLPEPNQTKYRCSEKEGCHDYQGGLDKFYMEHRDNKVTPRAINKLQDIKWHGLRMHFGKGPSRTHGTASHGTQLEN
ncbi:hypothetical protein AMECASPLE_034786 [Ameca splendens]|uniref:Uncharacterized protein n=1 Tax=Ameca splendens TaxID=208324 RepID=A0ABV0YIK9_9TELE